ESVALVSSATSGRTSRGAPARRTTRRRGDLRGLSCGTQPLSRSAPGSGRLLQRASGDCGQHSVDARAALLEAELGAQLLRQGLRVAPDTVGADPAREHLELVLAVRRDRQTTRERRPWTTACAELGRRALGRACIASCRRRATHGLSRPSRARRVLRRLGGGHLARTHACPCRRGRGEVTRGRAWTDVTGDGTEDGEAGDEPSDSADEAADRDEGDAEAGDSEVGDPEVGDSEVGDTEVGEPSAAVPVGALASGVTGLNAGRPTPDGGAVGEASPATR